VAEPVEGGLLREIDEELRQEKYAKLWQQYGKYIIAAAFALILGVAGFKGWQAYDLQQRTEDGEKFAAALSLTDTEQTGLALEALSGLAQDGGSGYALLARFRTAALLGEDNRRQEAADAYLALADDSGIDVIYRDMAAILWALNQLDNGDAAGLNSRLAPLTADDNPWRHSAKELTAVLALRAGDTDKARDLLQGLSSDATAPQGIRGRAAEMLAALGE
jgi:hypothetical protein